MTESGKLAVTFRFVIILQYKTNDSKTNSSDKILDKSLDTSGTLEGYCLNWRLTYSEIDGTLTLLLTLPLLHLSCFPALYLLFYTHLCHFFSLPICGVHKDVLLTLFCRSLSVHFSLFLSSLSATSPRGPWSSTLTAFI